MRLTQGGEPTFVSVDDRDGAEWNTEALGPTKRVLAAELMDRLREKYGAGGLLHYGQGKWYPGEQLPRWSLEPLLAQGRRADLDATRRCSPTSSTATAPPRPTRATSCAASRSASGSTPKYVFPAYEDVWYHLWRERKLPVNVDPFDARLDDELERERLRKVFDAGAGRRSSATCCRSRAGPRRARRAGRPGPWFLRDERCYLIPGDSAIGYRLPLDSQPWAADGDLPWVHPPDPTQPFAPLPAAARLRHLDPRRAERSAAGAARPRRRAAPRTAGGDRGRRQRVRASARRSRFESAALDHAHRAQRRAARRRGSTSSCRRVSALEDYLELVAAVEDTAHEMNLPVILEGYEPPRDPRLATLRVTPDPGVIEVNIHPAHSWDELVEQTTHLYEAAHETRLSTEKFMLDGRHTGTGGGNHFVLGGATPADSPVPAPARPAARA